MHRKSIDPNNRAIWILSLLKKHGEMYRGEIGQHDPTVNLRYLYLCLERMEKRGLVKVRTTQNGRLRRLRKHYSISDAGRRFLRFCREMSDAA